tara:strand:- start:90 stop:329 length:240 start_codon:yes stop_codon:yes gene_type:complete
MDRYTIVEKNKEKINTTDIFISNDCQKLINLNNENIDDYIDDYIDKYENEYIYNTLGNKSNNNQQFIYFAVLAIMIYNL